MNASEFVMETVLDDFLKAAKVNIYTGEYEFIKILQWEKEHGFFQVATIDEYIKKIVDNHLIYEDDVYRYQFHTDLNYLRTKVIEEKKRRMVHSFRRRLRNGFGWVTFEIIVPETFSQSNPWVAFIWKEADSDSRALEDALLMLGNIFHKILKINITEDTYEEIKVYPEELTQEWGYSSRLSQWFVNFGKRGKVFPEDLSVYEEFTNICSLRERLKKNRDFLRCRYRRKIMDSFRWVSMELLPSIEYTDENQVLMLYIRDIHDEYEAELQRRRDLEYLCNYDILTGIHNRNYFNNFCEEHIKAHPTESMGVLFADMNGLKFVNDTYGHTRGDEYIQKFSRILTDFFSVDCCCRISGDEFVVLLGGIEKETFYKKEKEFHDRLQKDEFPIAAAGAAWSEDGSRIMELTQEAEAAMYVDKEECRKAYPGYMRGRA